MKNLILIIFGVFLFFALMLYLAFRPKYSDASDEKPFSDIIGKKLTTKKESVIAVNPTSQPKKHFFVLEDGNNYNPDDLVIKAEIPIGSEIMINSVELHTGRVSGTTSAYLFGTIVFESGLKYDFEYIWGHYHSLMVDKPYWTFEKSFWQENELTEKFYIKVP